MKQLSLLILILVLVSCNKRQPLEGDYQDVIGSYEWSYTLFPEGDSVASNTPDNYALKLDSKGFCYPIINGEYQKRYKIIQISEGPNDRLFLELKRGKSRMGIAFEGGEVLVSTFPLKKYAHNVFLKVD